MNCVHIRSANQNGAHLIKMAREEIGLQPRSKVILRHTQQDFDTISSEVFLFSPFFTSVIRVLSPPSLKSQNSTHSNGIASRI